MSDPAIQIDQTDSSETETGVHGAPAAGEEVLQAEGIGVRFKGEAKREDFRSLVFRLLRARRAPQEEIRALDGVSFSGYAGEVVGVVGSNGAGKTTLCSVIGGILRPDDGTIRVHGEVSALLSMGTGFDRELSGRENIYLNGMMLGFSRREMAARYEEIAEFADLGEFIYQPVKHYSKGMRSRLGFSIASMLEPEVLVLDETLSTGDMEFAEKSEARLKEIVAQAKLVVVVTHNMDFIKKTCDRAIWIDAGQVRADGDPREVASEYEASVPKRRKRILGYEQMETAVTDRRILEVDGLGIRFSVNRRPFWSLHDVSFSVNEGEIVGVIGHNGAGKTTLCRAIAGIYRPDAGQVHAHGEISALLSLGTGFNSQLTAEDNIMLNGLMMGIPKKRMLALQDDILRFAELEKHRDRPVKYLSSGMKSRLSFSIAATIEPSLFIIDEALSAGDLAFKEKASEKMQEMIARAEAVIVVTHNLKFVKNVCTRAIWIDHGELRYDGEPDKAIKEYSRATQKRTSEKSEKNSGKSGKSGKKKRGAKARKKREGVKAGTQ